jgi:hypothetical protein
MEVSDRLHAPAALPSGKEPLVPVVKSKSRDMKFIHALCVEKYTEKRMDRRTYEIIPSMLLPGKI